MLVVLRPEAEQELLEAQAWYESKALGLGFEFGRAADAAIASAFRNPSGICASKNSSAGYYFENFLIHSFICPARMSCCWSHSYISIGSRLFGGIGLVAEKLKIAENGIKI